MKLIHYIIIIIMTSGILISITIQDGHDWGGDFSLYINQSKHIAEGFSLDEIYEWNKISIQNSIHSNGPYLYPNGFPFLLSPIYCVFDIDFILMKVFCSLFFLLSIPLLFNLYKASFKTNTYPIILVCLIAFNYQFIAFSDNILSDFPFFFFCFLTFTLMTFRNNFQNQLLLGFCLFYSYFIRDVGIFLIPTVFIYQLINPSRYKNNRIITIIPYIVFAILFFLAKSVFPNGGENRFDILFSDLSFNSIIKNIEYYILFFSRIFFFDRSLYFVGYTIVSISIIGAFSNRKKHFPYIVFTLLNVLILILWPRIPDMRLLFPIFPFLLLFLIHGIKFIVEKLKVNTKYIPIALTAYLVLFSLHSFKNTLSISRVKSNEAFTIEMVEIYKYVSLYIPSDKVVGFRRPRVLWLFSDAKSIYTNLDHFDESIADYLLIKNDPKMGIKKHEIQKEFQNYILLKK